MIVSRSKLLQGLTTSLLTLLTPETNLPPTPPTATLPPHPPPEGVDYTQNPTPFGKILRGEITTTVYDESKQLLTFRDRKPRAPLHALVIPKRLIPSAKELTPQDVELIIAMKEMALDVIQKEQPVAYKNQDYILCFHVPPFISVKHLHLHVLAPASEMTYSMRYGKYQVGTRWCVGVDYAIEKLEMGRKALPDCGLFFDFFC